MKKYLVSFVFLVLFAGYAALAYLNSNPPVAAYTAGNPTPSQPIADRSGSASQSAPPPNPTPVQAQPTPAPTPTQPTPTPAPAPKPKGEYVDGTYTGSTEDAFYGLVQVQVTISGGKIANVQFLQYPNDRSTSRFINQQAMPLLAQEAIQAQGANVDGVSGASDTSAAFVQSLGSALARAKA